MIPVNATGENAPALAPVQIMIAITNGLIPELMATVIPMGAMRATDAILPGPIADSAKVSRKKMNGSKAGCPRAALIANPASRSSVPFCCAIPNNRVTPTSVNTSCSGRYVEMLLTLKPAKYTPTT